MIELHTTWNLRAIMASKGLFQTTDLRPLLAERGVELSREQVYRLVTTPPRRISLEVLSALCDALECSKDELIVTERREVEAPKTAVAEGSKAPIGDLRPVRARIRRPKY
ncbi:XRE family transcriptional regulator [Arthrobacter sp. YC-RL1]|jgi:DNA-binding Xre family transcriptional regulator|uniref:HTH cro/C1-type domain-containing protein n=2 Tax=Micrococcaceae TaxID=1268 RepID=A0ABP9BU33_9MICC|nr:MULTISPECIES: helix-turn-helix transcriptional regulator [Micrococcaceae]SLF31006.1 putative transcriptional regulator [Mycobacteroides abscessus subsp. bolletii]ALQ31696.1 XRE family transcriptional regulator [Arthrobacter sp. YC-RL1]KLI89835.1 XRE family transcriptional regulator [Arthrobacter sp. YC-RL1]QRQ79021.1 helix-turn-helix transcriptional regulator [Glutamicibacter protophormiae]WIV44382.1 helix-turn-helix transcriptional regulator [Glutamicibacter nicotianae]